VVTREEGVGLMGKTGEEKKAAASAGQVEMYKYVEGQDFNQVERVIMERRSVRRFKDKQVPENLVRRLLEAGRFAPSTGNGQPWRFLVIRDEEVLKKMERDAQRICQLFRFLMDWRTSPLKQIAFLNAQVMIRLLPNMLHPIPFGAISLIAEGKLKLYHGAPTVIHVLVDRRGASDPVVDVGVCGENMVLAAHSLGLGTCWIGFVELFKFMPWWARRLGIKYPWKMCQAISIGYPVGHPDGMVPRETHRVDWFEDGTRKDVY
jgi:nitroreductase